MRRSLWPICAVLVACAGVQYGASDASLARARAASPNGAALFSQRCATCHGERGERSSSTPPILGPGALPEYPRERNPNTGLAAGDPEAMRLEAQSRPAGAPWRDPFRSAGDLFRYGVRPNFGALAAADAGHGCYTGDRDDQGIRSPFAKQSYSHTTNSGRVTARKGRWESV